MVVTPAETTLPPTLVLVSPPHAQEPPPPYPSRERRRINRAGRRRRAVVISDHSQVPPGTESDYDSASVGAPTPFPPNLSVDIDHNHDPTETTPLLTAATLSPRIPSGVVSRRQRTLSVSSNAPSIAPSLAHTVLSAFRPGRDCDLDPEDVDSDNDTYVNDITGSSCPALATDEQQMLLPGAEPSSPRLGGIRRSQSFGAQVRRYFRPILRRAYYSAMFHLLALNFPYALLAWVYLFVFTLTGTTTLMALPLGALLCFLDLLGARFFAKGEISLQTTFHGPLAFPIPNPPHRIFTRLRPPTESEAEAGLDMVKERSFYRNAYSMFTDATSYQALFYFLIIKPSITLILTISLLVLIPVSFFLILPFPAILRLVRRLGIWQANIAVEGLRNVPQ